MRDGWVEATLSQALEPIANHPNGKDYPLVLSVTEKRGIIPQTEIFKHRIATDDISKYKVLEPMDIAYNPYLLWCGAIGQWQGTEPGIVSPVYECFRVKSNCAPRYLGYVFETGILTNYFDALAIGSIVRRRRTIPSDFISAPIYLPPLPEQKRIVDLISSVDSYIEALEQQLAAAKNSRNAVLHELLNVHGSDWVETTLGQVSDVIGGGTPQTSVPEYWDGEIVWLTPTEVTSQDGKNVSDSRRKLSKLGFKNSGAQMLPKGSVILTSRASVGFVAISGIDLCTNQGFQSLVPKKSVVAEFLMFWIQHNRSEFESRSAGSTFKEISKTNVKGIKLLLPPLAEQKRIVEIISTIDELNAKTELALSEAKNLRSGLLSDLLSGEHEIPASYDKVMGAA
jgi:type I restriction enzyme S subunit